VIRVETGDLLRNPPSDDARSRVRNNQAQFAQTACAPALSH
jgi:hypothetical protein